MKTKILSLLALVVLGIDSSYSQSAVFVNGGLSFYPEMRKDKKNYNVSLDYYFNKDKKWFWQVQYSYTQNDFLDDYYKDNKALSADYVMPSDLNVPENEAYWEYTKTHSIGANVHYKLVDQNKFLLSATSGIHFSTNSGKKVFADRVNDGSDDVKYHMTSYTSNGHFGGSIRLGFHLEYQFYKKMLLGLNGGYNRNIEKKLISYKDNYFYTSLGLGYNF